MLPNKSGLSAQLKYLDSARYGISWGVIDAALRYAKERIQFNKPIGKFQL